MTRRTKTSSFSDFTGGLNADASPTSLEQNQAIDLDNIIILPETGIKKRWGNSAYNGTAMDSGAAVHGLSYYRQLDGTEYMLAIAGTKAFKSTFNGTMTDVTGAVTITTGQDYIWTDTQLNDLKIFVGGNRAADVPLKWNGAGNFAVLAGTPPVGAWGITANDRLFIGNTVANPSRVYWSVLGNPEDFSGAGSGQQDVMPNDGDTATGAELVGNNHLLIYKQNSVHDLVITTDPFPLFSLFKNVGMVGPRAKVVVDKTTYFITPEPRMVATDGAQIARFPDTINSIWDGLSKARLPYIQGFYDRNRHLILWFCSNGTSSTHNFCIAWDLVQKCWLKFTTGHAMNAVSLMQDRKIYGGAYNGKVYLLNDSSTSDDASETTTAVDAYWRSGWMDLGDMIPNKNLPYVDINHKTANTSNGSFTFSYGFDFNTDQKIIPISTQQAGAVYGGGMYDVSRYSGVTDKTRLVFTRGRGKFFQFRLRNNNTLQQFQINRLSFPIKQDAPYALR